MEIKGFQPKCTFYPDEVIPIAPGKAWVLILEEEKVTIPNITNSKNAKKQATAIALKVFSLVANNLNFLA